MKKQVRVGVGVMILKGKKLEFKGKKFNFLYTAHAIAEKIEGKTAFKKGESERFWDYQADDESYLSLGISDQTNERMECYGKVINPEQVDLLEL